MEWYKKKVDEVEKELSGDLENGLTEQEASKRLAENGENKLEEKAKKSFAAKLKDQLLDPMIIILVAASILSAAIGEVTDALIIIAIVILNAGLSIYQEGKAEEAIAALQKMASPQATVIRDGKHRNIDSKELVPGDIVMLETGNIIPADLRLIESQNLKVDESSLTGESVAVDKFATDEFDDEVPLGDRTNMAYSSTIVSYGRAKGIIIGTGKETEIGKIATSLENVEEEQTPLQRRLAQLSKVLGTLTVVVCLIVFAVGFFIYHNPALEMLMTAVSLGVAAIPEGLPAIVTIVLSLGMGRMAEKNAIVKKLLAVETLGTTTVICSDKTGTLTQNEMTVKKIYVDDTEIDVTGTGYEPTGQYLVDEKELKIDQAQSLFTLLHIATLSNDAKLIQEKGSYNVLGDPTEGALLTLAGKVKITREQANKTYPRIEEIPFDSERKLMTTFHENYAKGKIVSFTKGAPDIILEKCDRILLNNHVVKLTEEKKKEISKENSTLSLEALRVLAYAFKTYDTLPEKVDPKEVEDHMIFVGLTGMIDPPREEAKVAIQECKEAGIIPVMITGDYLETAYAIGKELGICTSQDEVIRGQELDSMTLEELSETVKQKRVYARVSPQNKVQIVTALKENGHIAAMTGDGVNDAPAIKKADIGIAMGITGTDVAKNTSEVILTDDNFATIVHAVHEGRIIYSNIKKFVSFLLSCNVGEILVVFLAILFDWPAPLIPIQLLWLNLVTDSFPALALGVEKGDDTIRKEKPRDPNEGIIDRDMIVTIILQSVAITASVLFAYNYGLHHFDHHVDSARTVAFATLIIAELLRSYTVRSDIYSVFHIGVFSNRVLVGGTALSFVLMLAVIYIPGVNTLFHNIPLELQHWAVIVPCAVLPFVVGELEKFVRRKLKN